MTLDPSRRPSGGPATLAPASLVLALDAATATGSVALLRGPSVVAEREVAMRGDDEERLMPAVSDLLAVAGVPLDGVAAIVCGEGPGSFTSLRIAASIAKGLALSARVPLYAVSSLALIVAGASRALEPGRYLAALDAMRGDLFVSELAVSEDGFVHASGVIDLMPAPAAAERARVLGLRMIGPGCAIAEPPRARGAGRLTPSPLNAPPVSLTAWEPFYGRLAEAQVRWEAAHGRPLPHG